MLKKILVALAVLVVALALFVATRPDTFKIERSTVVAAPPDVAFQIVNDFHSWGRFSPWDKLDPNMKRTHSGAPSGVGAVYEWSGNKDVGSGKMTIEESVPNQKVTLRLDFITPFAATNTTHFLFVPEGQGTKVTWDMEGKNNFMSKGMGLVFDMDKMVGGDFDKGLAALKSAAEGDAKARAEAEKQAAEEAAKRAAEAAAADPADAGVAPDAKTPAP